MNDAFEPVMSALFAHLGAAAVINFTADATVGGPVLENVSSVSALFAGLPVFGPGVGKGVLIQSVDTDAGTLTLTGPVTAGGSGAAFATGFLTVGRRLRHWSQVKTQPALFLRRVGTTDDYDPDGFFSITTLECEAWIYSTAGTDPDAVPDEALSNLDQLVRQSLAPDGDYGDPRFTLGGMVYWCRIQGRSDYSPGDQGDQGISRIPIRITLP
ncbi:MAG: hypothetical protein WA840_01015 [Caulobacteraceae bacterium]